MFRQSNVTQGGDSVPNRNGFGFTYGRAPEIARGVVSAFNPHLTRDFRLMANARRFVLLAAALVVAILVLIPQLNVAAAAEPSDGEGSVAVADLQSLVTTIESEPERQKLLSQLRALIEAQNAGEPPKAPVTLGSRLIDVAREAAHNLRTAVTTVVTILDDRGRVSRWVEARWGDAEWRDRQTETLGYLAVVLVAAFVGRFLARTAVPRKTAEAGDGDAWNLLSMAFRALRSLVPTVAFLAAGYAALVAASPPPETTGIALAFLFAITAADATLAVPRVLLVRKQGPGAQSDDTAIVRRGKTLGTRFYAWLSRVVVTAAAGWLLVEIATQAEMPAGGIRSIERIMVLLVTILAVAAILRLRRPVVAVLGSVQRRLSGDGGKGGARAVLAYLVSGFARIWHLIASVYVIVVFLIWATAVPDGIATMARGTVLTLVIFVVAGYLWHRLSPLAVTTRNTIVRGSASSLAVRQRLADYVPALATIFRVLIGVAAVVAVLQAWGVNALSWLELPVGQRLVSGALSILLVVGLAVVVWEAIGAAIEARLNRPAADETLRERTARLRTLLPLARRALLVLLIVIVTFLILSEIGLDITPLLAGAGVIGLAIGFGAQTLVKDVITGVFMLIEDALSVGDVVSVAGIGGVVESLSIRSIRLRDLTGNVHTIPFSSVGTVTNMTKDFSHALHDVGVAYKSDLDQVMTVCREIVEEMRADPALGWMILEPLEMLGVERFDDSAIIVRCRTKTRPGNQWTVSRTFNLRLKNRFDELGIEIPFPQRTLHVVGGAPAPSESEPVPEPTKSSLAAAHFFRREGAAR